MDTDDSKLNQILREIHNCEETKKKTQSEIEYYTRTIDTLNRQIEDIRRKLETPVRELEHYRKIMTELDRKFLALHQDEARRRDEITREQRAKM